MKYKLKERKEVKGVKSKRLFATLLCGTMLANSVLSHIDVYATGIEEVVTPQAEVNEETTSDFIQQEDGNTSNQENTTEEEVNNSETVKEGTEKETVTPTPTDTPVKENTVEEKPTEEPKKEESTDNSTKEETATPTPTDTPVKENTVEEKPTEEPKKEEEVNLQISNRDPETWKRVELEEKDFNKLVEDNVNFILDKKSSYNDIVTSLYESGYFYGILSEIEYGTLSDIKEDIIQKLRGKMSEQDYYQFSLLSKYELMYEFSQMKTEKDKGTIEDMKSLISYVDIYTDFLGKTVDLKLTDKEKSEIEKSTFEKVTSYLNEDILKSVKDFKTYNEFLQTLTKINLNEILTELEKISVDEDKTEDSLVDSLKKFKTYLYSVYGFEEPKKNTKVIKADEQVSTTKKSKNTDKFTFNLSGNGYIELYLGAEDKTITIKEGKTVIYVPKQTFVRCFFRSESKTDYVSVVLTNGDGYAVEDPSFYLADGFVRDLTAYGEDKNIDVVFGATEEPINISTFATGACSVTNVRKNSSGGSVLGVTLKATSGTLSGTSFTLSCSDHGAAAPYVGQAFYYDLVGSSIKAWAQSGSATDASMQRPSGKGYQRLAGTAPLTSFTIVKRSQTDLSSGDGEKRVAGATFKLYTWSESTQKYDKEVTTATNNGDGTYTFNNIPTSYEWLLVKETAAPTGYQNSYFLFDDKDQVDYNTYGGRQFQQTGGSISCYSLKNHQYPSWGFTFLDYPQSRTITVTKKDSQSGANLSGATFELWAWRSSGYIKMGNFKDNQNGTYSYALNFDYATKDHNGNYPYLIKETKAPPGYSLNTTNSNGKQIWFTSQGVIQNTGNCTFYNDRSTLTNTIQHWTFGYKNSEGNNGDKTAFHLGNTTFTANTGSKFTLDSSRAKTIPNGFTLSSFGSNSISGGTWTVYPIGTEVTQKNSNMYFQYNYTPVDYTITYNLGGGSLAAANPSTYNVLYGVTFNNSPTKPGYIFDGWYDGNTKVTGINVGCNATFTDANDLYTKLSTRTTGNKNITTKWKPITYTVAYNGNYNTGGSTASSSHTYDVAKNLTANGFTKTGYSFKNWNTKADGTGTSYSNSASVKNLTATNGATVTLYAQWTPNQYTLTVNPNGGKFTSDNSTSAKTLSPNLIYDGGNWNNISAQAVTRNGYTFLGWYDSATGGTRVYNTDGTAISSTKYWRNNTYKYAGNLTVYAQWSINSYYLDLNGWLDGASSGNTSGYGTADVYVNGNLVANDVTDFCQGIPYGSTYEIKDIKSTTGHTYNGVYSGSLAGQVGTSRINVFLNFTTNKAYIAYYPSGGTISSSSYTLNQYGYISTASDVNPWFHSISYGASDDPYNASTFGLTRTGYRFGGWKVRSTGKVLDQDTSYPSTDYADVISSSKTTANTSDVRCYMDAVWNANTYTITYNSNKPSAASGTISGSTANSSHTYDVAKNLTANGYSLTGWTFTGWNTKPDGTGTAYGNSASVKNLTSTHGATITLYAQWRANTYTVAYNGNGATGGSTASSSHTYDVAKNLTANGFTKTGHTFKNWNTKADGSGTSYSNSASVKNLTATNGATVTLYAQWTVNNYNLTVNPNGGTYGGTTSSTTVSVPYNTNYEVKEIPTRTGYTFTGWTKSGSGTYKTGQPNYVSGLSCASGTDSDGLSYTRYTVNYTNSSSGYNYPNATLFSYPYVSGHTYRLSFDVRVNSVSNIGYADLRHAGFSNNWEATRVSINGTTGGWVHKSIDRTFSGTTITQNGTTHNIAPQVEFFCAVPANSTGTMSFDLRNVSVYDVTGGYYVTSNTSNVKNSSTMVMGAGATTLTAKWTPNQYKLTLNPNKGKFTSDSSTSAKTLSPNLIYNSGNWNNISGQAVSRTGYLLQGWYDSATGGTKVYNVDGTAISGTKYWSNNIYKNTGDLTVYAQWKPITYTVAYNGNGNTGGSTASSSHTYNVDKNLTANGFTRTGYTFKNWNTKADGSGTSYGNSASVKNLTATNGATVTLYAQWSPNSYTVTYDANGGTGAPGNQSFKYNQGEKFSTTKPTRTGYAFVGWRTGTTIYNPGDTIPNGTMNLTLKAMWVVNSYYVHFNPNGLGGTMSDQYFTYDESKALSANAFSKTGYLFTKWTTASDGTGTSYSNKQVVSKLSNGANKSQRFKDWNPATHLINNGYVNNGWVEDTSLTTGLARKITVSDYTQGGGFYSFPLGSDATTLNNLAGNIVTVTFKAKASTPITFSTVGLESVALQSFAFDTTWKTYRITGTIPSNWADTYHAMVFYNPNANGTVYIGDMSVSVPNRVNLYAQKKPITYSVAYNSNKPSTAKDNITGTMSNSSHTYDVAKNLTTNAYALRGWTFTGWNTKADGTGTSYSNSASVSNLTATNGATVTLYAQWTINSYYLDLNGYLDGVSSGGISGFGTADVYINGVQKANDVTDFYQKINYGSTYEIKDIKATTGHTYNGVYSGSLTGTMDLNNIGVYLNFTTNKYTVAYNSNKPSKASSSVTGSTASSSHTYGVAKDLTTNGYALTGWTFKGWNTKADGTGTSYTNGQSVTSLTATNGATVTLYAQWTENSYTVTYNSNKPSTASASITGSTANSTHYYDTAKALTSNGYALTGWTFKGWNTKADGTGTSYSNSASVKNLTAANGATVTLYAQWTPITYTVAYNSNKPSKASASVTGTTANSSHTYDVAKKLTANGYKLTGWAFKNWNTKADGTGTSYSNSASVKNLTATNGSTVTLYAQWTPITYTVTYNSNKPSTASGTISGTTANSSHTYDVAKNLTSNGYKLTGWTFKNWNTKADGTGTSYSNSASVKNFTPTQGTTITLYAQWTANTYTVTYNSNKPSTASASVTGTTANSGHTYEVAKILTTNGYKLTGWTFTGWNTKSDGTGTAYADKASVKNLSSTQGSTVTLYAQWKANTYTVKYDSNKPVKASSNVTGTTANSSHIYDVTKNLTTNGYRITGWTFKEWNTKKDGTGTSYKDKASVKNLTSTSNGTVTLYAQWTANTYTIRFNGNESTSGSMGDITYTYDVEQPLPENKFEREKYEFAGWSTTPDGVVEYKDKVTVNNLTPVDKDIVTLYAIWLSIPEITTKVNYYYENSDVPVSEVLTNAKALDDRYGDISDDLIIKEFSYAVDSSVVTNPERLDTTKLGAVSVKYSITNDDNITVDAVGLVFVVEDGSELFGETDPGYAKVYSRYISGETLADGRNAKDTLKTNSVWKTSEYDAVLSASLNRSEALEGYDFVNSESFMLSLD